MELPKLLQLADSFENLEEELDKLDLGRRILIVHGKSQTKKVAEEVSKRIMGYELSDTTVESVTPAAVLALKEKCNVDFILAVGGGTVIDASKYAAYEAKKPLLVFPTAPSHDGISSPNVSMRAWGKLYSFVTTAPIAVFKHLPTLCSAPYELVRAGVGDALAKYTASRDLFLALEEHNYEPIDTEKLKEVAEKHFIGCAKAVHELIRQFKEKFYKKFVSNLFDSLFVSGVGMAKIKSSIGASGSEHNIAHMLECKHRRHGEKVAIASIPMMYLQQSYLDEEKVYGMDWQTLRQDLATVGIPTNAREFGISEEEIVQAVPKALELGRMRKRYTILDYVDRIVPVNKEFACSLLKKTKIIYKVTE
jgi:glycerol-1-phosphate dehydrogenase [NAD(P)+]